MTSEPVWIQMNDDKIWHPATICKEYSNSPQLDMSFKGRVVKKHANRIKNRVVPVINMKKQAISEELKVSLRERLAADDNERKLNSYIHRKCLVALTYL